MRIGGWILLWLLVAGPALAKPPVLVLPTADTSVMVWQYAELLEDLTHHLSLSEALSPQPPLAFSSTTRRSTQLGFSPSDFWLRFRVRNNDNSNHRIWILHILHFFANRLTLFLVDEKTGQVVEKHTGEGTPMASWDMPYQEGAFRLTLLPDRTYTVLLRLSGNNSKAFTPVISEMLHYYQFIQWSTYSLALYNGMLIFAIVLQLIFFGFTRERNFIFYALYLLGVLLVVVQSGNGLPGEVYFWPDNEWLNLNGMALASSGCAMFGLLFYANGLKLKTHSRWLILIFRAVYLLIFCTIVSILTNWSAINTTEYAVIVSLLFLSLTLIACLVSLINGFKPARYYLLATLSFLVGIITLELWHRGLIPINLLTTYCVPMGSLSEIIFFIIALADDYRRTHHQEQKAQQQLIDTLQQQNQQISSALLQGQTLERKRVAADLHDNLGSTLSALRWSLEAIDKTKLTQPEQSVYVTLNQQLNQAYDDIRLLSHNLLPDELAKQGLAIALTILIDKLNRNTPVRFHLLLPDTFQRHDQQTEFELYSICLELLNNILKHANATEVHLTLIQSNTTLELLVSDNGVGLDGHRKEGKGLQNVTARVDALGGAWAINSNPGEGVQHQITIPIRAQSRISSPT